MWKGMSLCVERDKHSVIVLGCWDGVELVHSLFA